MARRPHLPEILLHYPSLFCIRLHELQNIQHRKRIRIRQPSKEDKRRHEEMKIYIFGKPGSGKTTIAQQLSRQLHIMHYDLDDIAWKKKYTIQRKEAESQQKIKLILKKRHWIIEGAWRSMTKPIISAADIIIELKPYHHTIIYRLIKRHLQRKKEEKSIKDTFLLIKASLGFHNKRRMKKYHEFYTLLQKNRHKYYSLTHHKQLNTLPLFNTTIHKP